jgi:phage/plasmid-like protein (TIGR03299 family)
MGNLATGFSGRSLSFYSLPQARVFDRELTVSEALTESGMDFTVGKRPVFQQLNDGSFTEVPGKFATYRMDTESSLGVVGNQYTVFNNNQAFDFVDELLGFGAVIDAAGTWNNGADVFISAQLQNGIKVEGEEDLSLHILFRNNHAGLGAISGYITPHRLSCTNQMRSAIKSAVSQWKARHTRNVAEKVQEAANAMRLVDTYREAMEGTIQGLQEAEFELSELDDFLKELTASERVQANIREMYNTSETVTRGNRWGVFNSVTEALDWAPARRTGPESRFASSLDGPNQRTRDRAMRLLTVR